MTLAKTGHLLVGHSHLLQSIGQELPSALESRELFNRLLHPGPDLVQPAHARGQIRSHAVEAADILPERARAGGLLRQRRHLL
jgi:hypothetical protein